jgi:hypothetical protein
MPRIIGIYIAETNGDASMSRKTSAALMPVVRELTVIAVLATRPRGTNRHTGKSGMNIA